MMLHKLIYLLSIFGLHKSSSFQPEEKPKGWLANEKNPIKTIVIYCIVIVMVIAFIVFIVLRSCNPCGPNWGPCYSESTKPDDTDAETGTTDSLPMKESTDTEKVMA